MYSKHTFKNGLRVILAPRQETQAVTLLILFGVGSRYETKKINGLSHFLEHMFFKGTKKRPSTLAISKMLDGVGAGYNAFTGKDHTGYYITINHEKAELAIDMLSDMLLNSLFDAKELEREKNVITEEIHMYKDNPMMHVETLLEELIFAGNTLGWDIAGSKETVHDVNRKTMIAYRKKHYRPDNTVIAIAGRVNSDLSLVKKYFDPFKKPSGATPKFKKFTSTQKAPRFKMEFKETEQVQLALGFPAYSYGHPDLYAAQMLAIILGGNMSSRLFINVRERQGLAYFVRASAGIYQDAGNFTIQAGLEKKRIEQAIKTILKELKKVKQSGVSEAELKRAKDYMKGKLILRFEDSSNRAAWFAQQELMTKTILTPDEKIAAVAKVTTTDVQRVAKELFVTSKLNMALIGPFDDDKKFKSLLRV